MSHTEQFRARLADIKSVVNYQTQLKSLKWAMGEQKKALEAEEAAGVAALDHWHDSESTDPKPVVPDYTETKAKLDTASATVDKIVASMNNTNALIDQATKELT